MNTDLSSARSLAVRPLYQIAADLGPQSDEPCLYGTAKAEVLHSSMAARENDANREYINVNVITPSRLGKGKTMTAIGLLQGLGKHGQHAMVCIRQPPQGPTFGIKGNAAGGERAQVIPMEEFNLHLTGDMHAISAGFI